ncbi:hypothetical protein V8E55_000737 [Tylopilus felleus]
MDNIMDPELATEMVKLFAQELKVVRAQLCEAERRTSTLEAENAALQERIARLQDALTASPSIKSEEGLPSRLQYAEVSTSQMSEEFARLRAENEDLIREKEKASRFQEKLSTLQEKYKRSKAKVHECNEMLNELRVALSNSTEELEQSRKAVISEIDCGNFQENIPYEPVEGQWELSSIQPHPRAVHTELHKDAVDVCEGLYFINTNEVIWSPSGKALGLVIKPTFQYNPKIQGGTWTKLQDAFDVGKRMDLCCWTSQWGKTTRYLGTYERVADQATMIIASETLKDLAREKLDYASKCTTLFPDLVPPSQTQMIKNMYKKGVIKLQCFVIRCVAVNQAFAKRLWDTSTPSIPRSLPDNAVIPTSAGISSRNVRKRKRDSKSRAHSTREKKR